MVLVRRIAILGAGVQDWKKKPPLPDGGALEILSACYFPDPQPPAASQAVEGRHVSHMPADKLEKPNAVPIYSKMQRLYEEHTQFGGLRVVVRNSGTVPTRIVDTLLLNGKPIEDSYVDFVGSDWDARGVVPDQAQVAGARTERPDRHPLSPAAGRQGRNGHRESAQRRTAGGADSL